MAEPTKRPTDEQLREWASCVVEISTSCTEAVLQRQVCATELLELRTALHAAGIKNTGELVTFVEAVRDGGYFQTYVHAQLVQDSLVRLTAPVSTEEDAHGSSLDANRRDNKDS